MSRFTFSLATSADDAQLRARMAEDRMEGNIAISFRREPSYFAGSRLQGDRVQVITCHDTFDRANRIVGLGARASCQMHVNGQPLRIGYLSDLRADPQYRNGTLLARGYRFLRTLHEAEPLPLYVSIIFDTNRTALQTLVGGRAGLPNYTCLGKILTPALHLDFPRRAITLPGVTLRRAQAADLPAIVRFLNRRLATRQFSPVYAEADFLPGGRCTGLRVTDFFVAIKDAPTVAQASGQSDARTDRKTDTQPDNNTNKQTGSAAPDAASPIASDDNLLATLAAWDQAGVRQTHIERYSTALNLLRPLYNLASKISPLKPLPAVGSRVPYLYWCCIAVHNDDLTLLRALVRHAYRALRTGPWHYAIMGLHERDPLAPVLKEYRQIPAAGLLYRVDFADSGNTAGAAGTGSTAASERFTLDNRIPCFEMALA